MVKKQTKHKKCNICIALGKIEGKKELVNQQIKQANYYCCKNNKCSCYHTGKQAGSKEEQERIIDILKYNQFICLKGIRYSDTEEIIKLIQSPNKSTIGISSFQANRCGTGSDTKIQGDKYGKKTN